MSKLPVRLDSTLCEYSYEALPVSEYRSMKGSSQSAAFIIDNRPVFKEPMHNLFRLRAGCLRQ